MIDMPLQLARQTVAEPAANGDADRIGAAVGESL